MAEDIIYFLLVGSQLNCDLHDWGERGYLDPFERDQVNQFRDEKERTLRLASRISVKRLLSTEFSADLRSISVLRESPKNGLSFKPRIIFPCNIYHSISVSQFHVNYSAAR